MIIKTDLIKPACATILSAVDSADVSMITETLEIISRDNVLYLNVTNREYFTQVKVQIDECIDFHATVNATLFLKLIPQITTEEIELNVVNNCLEVKANGVYKFPLIFEGDKLLELPKIKIENVTSEFTINSSILHSILNYNSKELNKKAFSKLVQRYYYVDDKGCITFTSGACVNNFDLPNPVKILLSQKIVKLFKLFDGDVLFTLGYDEISDDIVQTKVKFECNNIVLTAILSCDDSLINSVPVNTIREMAVDDYKYSIVLNRDAILQAINRLLLFSSSRTYGNFKFNEDSMEISLNGVSTETISYCNDTHVNDEYNASIDLIDVKLTLENCSENYITLNFGNNRSVVVIRNNIYNVIPEVMEQ